MMPEMPYIVLGSLMAAGYILPVIAAAYLWRVRHGRPATAWVGLVLFSLLREGLGGVMIYYSLRPLDPLKTAMHCLIELGMAHLVISTMGLLDILLHDEFDYRHRFRHAGAVLTLVLGVSIVLVVTGAFLGGFAAAEENTVTAGLRILQAGSICLVAFYGLFLIVTVALWTAHLFAISIAGPLKRNNVKILSAITMALPLLLVQQIAGMIFAFSGRQATKWSSSSLSKPQNLAVNVVMVFVMEFMVVWIYILMGFSLPASKGQYKSRLGDCIRRRTRTPPDLDELETRHDVAAPPDSNVATPKLATPPSLDNRF